MDNQKNDNIQQMKKEIDSLRMALEIEKSEESICKGIVEKCGEILGVETGLYTGELQKEIKRRNSLLQDIVDLCDNCTGLTEAKAIAGLRNKKDDTRRLHFLYVETCENKLKQ